MRYLICITLLSYLTISTIAVDFLEYKIIFKNSSQDNNEMKNICMTSLVNMDGENSTIYKSKKLLSEIIIK